MNSQTTFTRVKLIEGLHVTATEKRHICQLINQQMTEGGTRAKFYKVTEDLGNRKRICIQDSSRTSTILVELN